MLKKGVLVKTVIINSMEGVIMRKVFWLTVLVAVALGNTTPVFADASGDMMSMLESMKQQMSQMQQTIDQQNSRIQQLESKTVVETPKPSTKLVPEGVQSALTESDWQKGIKDNIGEAIPWMKGAKYGGDFRLRYEAFDYFKKNNERKI